MSTKAKNFLSSWLEEITGVPLAAPTLELMDGEKSEYRQRRERINETKRDRAADKANSDPSRNRYTNGDVIAGPFEQLRGIDDQEMVQSRQRIDLKEIKDDADLMIQARRLKVEPKLGDKKGAFENKLERLEAENTFTANPLRDTTVDPSSLSAVELKQRTERNDARRAEQDRYGVLQPDGRTRINGSVAGQLELQSAADASALINQQIEQSKSAVNVNEGTLALNEATARDNRTQQTYTNERDEYRYEDNKVEQGLQREYEGQREDARFNANLETIKLQNAAEMERYEMMLQNDREVRQGESISDLLTSLTVLGGAFMI